MLRAETTIKVLSAGLATLVLPFFLTRGIFSREWRLFLAERLSYGGWSTLHLKYSYPRIWVHAASMGEVAGASALVNRLKEKYPDSSIHITTTSLTGKQAVLERKLCDTPCLLPLDHPVFQGRAIDRVRPSLFLLFETELWPNLLFQLNQRRIPVLLINGRISDFSFPKYKRLRSFFRPVLNTIKEFFVQTDLDAKRFALLGADIKRITVVGSTKFDCSGGSFLSEEECLTLRQSLGLTDNGPCFVAGSVRPGEEEIVIRAYLLARKTLGNLQMIFAPRHPERFEESARLLRQYGIDFHRRIGRENTLTKTVVLLDTLGELQQMYALASVTFIGGTLVNIGGHNPLEAASYQVPILVGPYTQNVREIITLLEERGALFIVKDALELSHRLIQILTDDNLRRDMGEKGVEVWKENIGATERVLKAIEGYLGSLSPARM